MIRYLNTDLDLTSANELELTELVAAFEASDIFAMQVIEVDNGLWLASFETGGEDFEEPQSNIEAIIGVVESWPKSLRLAWNHCVLREFNIGYECSNQPRSFDQGLSVELLSRMVAVSTSLRITLYPCEGMQ